MPATRMLENGHILGNKYFLYPKTHISPMIKWYIKHNVRSNQLIH